MDIFEYIKDERKKFTEKDFNILDSIVLSKLVYLNFGNIIPKEGVLLKDIFKAEYYEEILNGVSHKEAFIKLFILTVLSPRYRNIRLKYYVDDIDEKAIKQFAALTFVFNDKMYIAYRGTDMSVIAWHENFQMTFTYPIESQKQALDYLRNVARKERKKIIIGGHSKGGNLAIYAGINAHDNLKKKIINIYSLDGPGFPDSVFASKEYKKINEKIIKVIPKESIVGIMFEKDKYLVCKSNETGVLQHEPFFWRVKDEDLVYLKQVSKTSIGFSDIMTKWIETATVDERELFIETLFSLVHDKETPDLYSKLAVIQKTPRLIRSYSELEPERKEFINNIFKNLLRVIVGLEDKDIDKKIKLLGE